jgi:hypothetical protein
MTDFSNGPLVMAIAAILIGLLYLGYRLKAPVALGFFTVVFVGSVVACFNIMNGL